MDLIYHGHCLDGSFCVTLFCLAYQILKREFHLTKREIQTMIEKKLNISKNENNNRQIYNNFQVKQKEVLEYPLLNLLEEGIQFFEVKLTNYNKNFQTLLQENQKKNKNKQFLFIFDVSPPIDLIQELSKYYKTVFIFDHHESFLKNLQQWQQLETPNIELIFSYDKSASLLLYEYINQNLINFDKSIESGFLKDLQQKLNAINQNDTSIVENIEICRFIEYAMKMKCDEIGECPERNCFLILKKKFNFMQILGKPLIIIKEQSIEKVLSQCQQFTIKILKNNEFEKIQCYGTIQGKIKHVSIIGSILAKKSHEEFGLGLGLVVSKRFNNKIYISFRGHSCDSSINCETLASYFDGGGHKKASGCIISQEKFEFYFEIVKQVNLITK